MQRFRVADGLFWLDDKPLFLQAGELHYFRTPPEAWAHRLGLLHAAGFNAVATYIPWLWHEPEEGAFDFDGATHPQRDLAGFLDLAAHMGFYLIARPGPYIMAETTNEGIPPWVFARYPQVMLADQHGRLHAIASYLHPGFRTCAERWYRAVFGVLAPRQITRGGRIVLVQLDNEMGMLHWVKNLIDINPDTLDRFAAHLRATYGERLAARYPTHDLTGFLRTQLTQPTPPYAARVMDDYRRFHRNYLRDYAIFLRDLATACGLEVPPVINIHGFGNGGKTFPIGLSQLAEAMRITGMVSATDVYPLHIGEDNIHHILLVNAMTVALQNRDQPLFSIEFQAGGNQDFSGAQTSFYDLHSRLSIACGMRGVNHYLFADGENPPEISPTRRHDWGHPVRKDGTTRRHYARYPRLSRMLAAYGRALIRSRPRTVTTIGFMLDHFMTEVNNALTQPETDALTHQREVILFDFIARGLALTHRPFDAIELSRVALDPAHMPTLWAMIERRCDADVQDALLDYVRRGGRLIMVGRMCVEASDGQPCTQLKDGLGISEIRGGEPFRSGVIRAFDYTDVPASFIETYAGAFDEVFATHDGDVTGFVKVLGEGQAMMLGAALAANTLDDLDIFHRMANRMGCAPLFALSDWADVHLSEGEDGAFLFIQNYQDDPIETTVACAGKLLFGGHAIRLPARRGAILPFEWRPALGVTVHYLTAEVIGLRIDEAGVCIETDPPAFTAELTLEGYRCNAPDIVQLGDGRLRMRSTSGVVQLSRC
ncbi:MAG: beta-galactosidase [Anaerolineae bacterium]|nr:beta-galactosidase [Candidatus Roseilinea sp.]MDW8451738.1 beta-galactosidase [Anaerolineae bacterium]